MGRIKAEDIAPGFAGPWRVELWQEDGQAGPRVYGKSASEAAARAMEASREPPRRVTVAYSGGGKRWTVAHRGDFESRIALLALCEEIDWAGCLSWRQKHPVPTAPVWCGTGRKPWMVYVERIFSGHPVGHHFYGATSAEAAQSAERGWPEARRPTHVAIHYLREGKGAMLAHDGVFATWKKLVALCAGIDEAGLYRWRAQHGLDLRTKATKAAKRKQARLHQEDVVAELIAQKGDS
jgi:hypothetical protein